MIASLEFRLRSTAKQFHNLKSTPILLSVFIGLVMGLLLLWIGPPAVPLVIFVLLILPWLLKDPFRLYLWLLVTWPVLTLYARIPASGSLPDITHERLMAPLIFGIILIDGLVSRKKLPQVGFFAGIYIAAQVISRLIMFISGSVGTPEYMYFLNIIVLPAIMYWITKNLLVSRWHLTRFLYALILATVIICFTGIYERAVGGIVSPFPVGVSTLGYMRWLDVPGGRASGVIGNPAIFGGILGFGILACLCCIVHAKQKAIKFTLGGTIFVLLYGVFISFTRAAWISVAVVLFFVQFTFSNLWKKTLPVFILGALTISIFWSGLIDNPVVIKRILNPITVEARLDMATVAIDKFLERPFLGWGPGTYNQFIYQHVVSINNASIGASSSHNTYLTLLVDGGLLVFMSFVALTVSFFVKAYQVIHITGSNSFERSVLWVMLGCISIFLLLGLSNDLRDFIYLNVLFWVAGGTIESLKVMCEMERLEVGIVRESQTLP